MKFYHTSLKKVIKNLSNNFLKAIYIFNEKRIKNINKKIII